MTALALSVYIVFSQVVPVVLSKDEDAGVTRQELVAVAAQILDVQQKQQKQRRGPGVVVHSTPKAPASIVIRSAHAPGVNN